VVVVVVVTVVVLETVVVVAVTVVMVVVVAVIVVVVTVVMVEVVAVVVVVGTVVMVVVVAVVVVVGTVVMVVVVAVIVVVVTVVVVVILVLVVASPHVCRAVSHLQWYLLFVGEVQCQSSTYCPHGRLKSFLPFVTVNPAAASVSVVWIPGFTPHRHCFSKFYINILHRELNTVNNIHLLANIVTAPITFRG
jgi:hypothetical protein